MTRTQIEKYLDSQVEITYNQTMRLPGIVIIDGTERDSLVKKEIKSRRVGVIYTLTTSKVVLIVDDDDKDIEIFIPFEKVTKIEKI